MRSRCALALAFLCLLLSVGCSRSASYYVESGNRFFAAKNYDEAALQYRKALIQDPRFAEAEYRLGLVEIERGNAIDALAALTHATQLDPQKWEAKAKLGDLCISLMIAARSRQQVIYNAVVNVANEFLRKDPNSFDGLRMKGYLATLDRKPEEAVGYFRRAHQLNSNDSTVGSALAEALLKSGQGAEGEALARQIISTNKAYAPPYEALYQYYFVHNRPKDAEAILIQKAEADPQNAANWIQLATHYRLAQKAPQMAAVLQKLLNDPKTFPGARITVGDFYVRTRQYDEAFRVFSEGLSMEPSRKIEYLRRVSNVQQSQGKPEDALRTVEEVLKIKPDDEDSLGLKASLLRARGTRQDKEQALEISRELVKRKPSNALWQLGLGRSLVEVGPDYSGARTALQEALRLDPSLEVARYLLAETLIRQGKWEEPVALANQILAEKPRDPQARLIRAVALRGMKQFEGARRELKALEREYPKAYEVQFQLGLVALAEEKHKEAKELFQKLYRATPTDYRSLEGLVNSQIAQNQIADAIHILDSEVKKTPESSELRLMLAGAASRVGESELAIQQYEYLLKLDPKSAGLYMTIGRERLARQEPEKALTAFQKAAEISPSDPNVTGSIAVALEAAGRLPEAMEQYRRTLKLDADNAVAQNNLAYLIAETGGDLDEAMRLIQQAVRKFPQHPGLADTLGWIYLKKNMTGSAHQVFVGLVKKDPRNPAFQYHLASTLYAQGDKEGARNALKSGLENKPSASTERKMRELLARLG